MTQGRVSPINVKLGRLDTPVTQQLGQTVNWHPMFSQTPGKSVTQLMAAQLDLGLLAVLLQPILDPRDA